jgi:hypothetical protein
MPPWKGEETLVFNLGKKYCCFAVSSTVGKQLYELAYYTTDEVNESMLNQLMTLHPELRQSFKKVLVNYDQAQIILLPASKFKNENALLLLHAMYSVGNRSTVLTEPVKENEAYAVYAVPEAIHNWVLTNYPTAVYGHSYRSGIKTIPNENVTGCIRADFGTEQFSVIVSKGDQLFLVQTFPYSTPDDVMYYLLKTCQQFSLSALEVKLVLSGLIEKQSALFHELYQYFINIEFKNADWTVNEDNEYPLHFFASLNEFIQCES